LHSINQSLILSSNGKLEKSVAYANKAVTLIWGMIWGALLFKEQITPSKTAGILLVIVGIVILNGKKEEGTCFH